MLQAHAVLVLEVHTDMIVDARFAACHYSSCTHAVKVYTDMTELFMFMLTPFHDELLAMPDQG
jgi:membrane-anchored protein YejM (alkaline phosphatase superfamily)